MKILHLDEKVVELLQSVLGVNDIDQNDSPETIPEWDSFNQIVIIDELSREFNIKFDDDLLMHFYTVRDLVDLVKSLIE